MACARVKRQFGQHLRRCGQRVEFHHTAVDDAVDAHFVFPAWQIVHVGEWIAAFGHDLVHGVQLLGRIRERPALRDGARVVLELRRVRVVCHAVLLLR